MYEEKWPELKREKLQLCSDCQDLFSDGIFRSDCPDCTYRPSFLQEFLCQTQTLDK